MNSTTKRVIIALIVVAIIGFFVIPRLGLFKETEPERVNTNSASTAKMAVADGIIINTQKFSNKVNVTGTILPNESVDLRSQASGVVSRILFEEGQKVKKGQLLLTIDDDQLQAQLQKIRFNKKLYEDREFRQRQLLTKEAISQQEYDIAITELNTALADIRLLEAQINDARIHAPFDGTIGLRKVSEGAYISPTTSVAQLYSINPVKIDFSIPGRYSNQVKKGSEILFTIDASNKTYRGAVFAVEPQIDVNTRTVKVRAQSPNVSGEVVPGQFAKIELILEQKSEAILIPSSAIIPIMNGNKVLVKKNGKVEEVLIEIGVRTEREVEVLSGLAVADTVLTSGLLQLRVGTPVNVQIK